MKDPTGAIAKQLIGKHNEINGKYVDIKHAEDGKTRETVEKSSSKVFVGGIEGTVSTEELRDYFQSYGEVKEAVVLKNINTNTSRGFGFVTFEDSSIADKLIRENNCVLKGKRMDVKTAEPKDSSAPRGGGMRGGYHMGDRGHRGGRHHGYGHDNDYYPQHHDRNYGPPQYDNYNNSYNHGPSSRYGGYPPADPAPVATLPPYAPPQQKNNYGSNYHQPQQQNSYYGSQSK